MLWSRLVAGPLMDMLPGTDTFVGLEAEELRRFLPTFAEEASPLLRLGVTASAVIYQLLPLFVIGVPLPAFMLSTRLRDRYALKISKHPIYFVRQPVFLLKLVAGLAWGRLRAVREQLALPAYPPDEPSSWRTS